MTFTTGPSKDSIYILSSTDEIQDIKNLNDAQKVFLSSTLNEENQTATINQYDKFLFFWFIKKNEDPNKTAEQLRKAGAAFQVIINKHKLAEISIISQLGSEDAAIHVAEGIALANYQFLKYKTDAQKQTNSLTTISIPGFQGKDEPVKLLQVITEAVYKVRTLVNEPLSYLSAVKFAEEFAEMGNEAGFDVTVYQKEEIEKEKMGGLLAVNRGSQDPPTFSVMEYNPANATNTQPIVLIGKGIVYDTGGLSLKPTPDSMDRMKSDMSGGALVAGVLYAAAKMQLPLHLIGLVPATDNRPGENAYVPGDVITMYSGKTVEVLNTDAEGRLVLADALHWAKRYNPLMVFDFATLTGAASAATGKEALVCMGNASEEIKKQLEESGYSQQERMVEFPLYEEYGELIKSTIADIKNIGGPVAGAITAGKFLEHFVSFPWMHFDIAGVSHDVKGAGYLPAGGTAFGLRMMIDFLIKQVKF